MASTLLGVAVLALSVPETAGQGTRTAVSVDVIQKHVGIKSQQQPERHLGRMVCSAVRTEDFDPSAYKALRPGAGKTSQKQGK